MKAIDLLATNLNRRDDLPNKSLALEIIKSKRLDWIKELVENLHNKDKNIQSDCIKALYEIGENGFGDLIAPYCNEFGKILESKNNRLVWGAMTAIDAGTLFNPEDVFALLPVIIKAIDKGSVITIDHGVSILARLASFPAYTGQAFPLMMEQLKRCPPKQLPMYAEKSEVAISQTNKKQFLELFESRMPEMERDSQKKRLSNVIKRISKK